MALNDTQALVGYYRKVIDATRIELSRALNSNKVKGPFVRGSDKAVSPQRIKDWELGARSLPDWADYAIRILVSDYLRLQFREAPYSFISLLQTHAEPMRLPQLKPLANGLQEIVARKNDPYKRRNADLTITYIENTFRFAGFPSPLNPAIRAAITKRLLF